MRTTFSRAGMVLMTGALTLTIGACVSQDRAWHYPPQGAGQAVYTQAGISLPYRLAVPPLQDERGTHNEASSYWTVSLPFVPYAERTFERPEALQDPEFVDTIVFDPPRDLSRAIVSELERAGIFSSVAYTEDAGPSQADFVLEGTLRSTTWSRRVTTYGFGGVGTVFWFLGAPVGPNSTALQLDLKLVSAEDPSRTLWSFRMMFRQHHLEGPYYGLPESVRNYPLALQRGLEVAVADLARLAADRPELFKRKSQKLAAARP